MFFPISKYTVWSWTKFSLACVVSDLPQRCFDYLHVPPSQHCQGTCNYAVGNEPHLLGEDVTGQVKRCWNDSFSAYLTRSRIYQRKNISPLSDGIYCSTTKGCNLQIWGTIFCIQGKKCFSLSWHSLFQRFFCSSKGGQMQDNPQLEDDLCFIGVIYSKYQRNFSDYQIQLHLSQEVPGLVVLIIIYKKIFKNNHVQHFLSIKYHNK